MIFFVRQTDVKRPFLPLFFFATMKLGICIVLLLVAAASCSKLALDMSYIQQYPAQSVLYVVSENKSCVPALFHRTELT